MNNAWGMDAPPRPRFFGYRKTIPATRRQKREAFPQKEIDIWLGRWAKIFVANTSINSSSLLPVPSRLLAGLLDGDSPVAGRFLQPLARIIPKLSTTRVCPELPDEDWLALGVLRVLFDAPSGRGFLQEVGPNLPACPDFNHFFATLRSERRLKVCQEAASLLNASVKTLLPDTLAEIKELAGFDVYATDGHWHGAAAHDRPASPGKAKSACGHFYALDLRHGPLHHLTAADQVERQHEHDMRALKRQSIDALRLGAPKGRKVVHVYDKAGIDFRAWDWWKRIGGIYFVSQEKESMALVCLKNFPWDRSDKRNAGVKKDEQCRSSHDVIVRRVTFEDPITGGIRVFITSEMTLPPGIIAELARRRWNIEKVFDELKNKLGETRAWATSATARSMQATFICLTHQLLLVFEQMLENDHGIRPEAELKRRADRLAAEEDFAIKNKRTFPVLRACALRLTQRTVKFLRWLRASFTREAPWLDLIAVLRHSYASL